MSNIITSITAREILDSRGFPTIEACVTLNSGIVAVASVPSGTSTGEHEAHELRDYNPRRFRGRGVLRAVENVEKQIAPRLVGVDVRKQRVLDEAMIDLDGTDRKERLGANAMLAVSLACARAASREAGKPLFEHLGKLAGIKGKIVELPVPCFNIFNGGKHADTNLDFQEFMIVPLGGMPLSENVRMGAEIFYELGDVLREAGFDTDVGSEGGYAPDIISSIQAMEFIMAATIRAGYHLGRDIGLGIDVGSSGLYDLYSRRYIFRLDHASFTSATLVSLYYDWFKRFNVVLLEDGLAQDDWEGWQELTAALGSHLTLVGDDLFVTSRERLQRGIDHHIANAVVIKPNQIGTLTESIDCAMLAKAHGYKMVVSHRSGETSDDFIADLAVALRADFVKFGSLSRGERVAKYNRLMAIEQLL